MTDIGIRDISVSFRDNKISNISLVQGDALTRGFDITFVNAKGEVLPPDDDYVVELIAVNSKDKDTPYACRHEVVDDKYRVMIPPEALSDSGSVTIQLVFYQKSTKAVIHTIKQKCPVYQSIGQEFVDSNNLYIDITALRLGLEKIEKLDGKYEEIIEKDMEIQVNEANRKEAEKKRNLDEIIRKDNESIRNSNEEKREQLKTALIELKNSIESDLESINLTVDDIISSEDDRKQNEIIREEIKVELENLVADIQNKLDNGDFVGEKGEQGIQGEQGPQGPPGEVAQEEFDNLSQEVTAHKEDYATQRQQGQLKIATVEKELQNYKSIMANINVNQEVKQSVSGYGSVSLPKNTANGQVSASVKGRTLKNEFNYNKDTMEQWRLITDNSTKGESKITLKGKGIYINATLPVFVKPNTKYGILYTVLISNVPSFHLGSNFHPFRDTAIPTHLGNVKVIQTTKELWAQSVFRFYLLPSSTDEHSITISIPRMFELPPGSEIETDFETLTADQLAIKYPYVSGDGTKSTVSASRLKSVDKDGIQESTLYLPNVGELRSLPNGVCDEVKVSGGKGEHIKRVSDTMEELAEPITTPIKVSGTLLSNPSGTVYVEPVVADAGIYDSGINVLDQGLPIDYVEILSKVDFTTGLETELDISKVVISEDKKSFTHPNLVDGDIIFFTYFHNIEGTEGELSMEYYDSRHVLKDTVTGKFYKIVQTVTDGVLTDTLVEV